MRSGTLTLVMVGVGVRRSSSASRAGRHRGGALRTVRVGRGANRSRIQERRVIGSLLREWGRKGDGAEVGRARWAPGESGFGRRPVRAAVAVPGHQCEIGGETPTRAFWSFSRSGTGSRYAGR